MTIDANIIEGFKIGFAAGFVAGVLATFAVSLIAFYGIRKRIKEQLRGVE